MGKTNIIELNGRRYDSSNGTLLGEIDDEAEHVAVTVHKPAVKQSTPAKVVDGIVGEVKAHHHKSKAMRRAHHMAAHKPIHTSTLMRQAVQKPAVNSLKKLHIQTPLPSKASKHQLAATHQVVNSNRVLRAQGVAKSPAVSHFAGSLPEFIKRVEPVAVHAAPAAETKPSRFDEIVARAESHKQRAPRATKSRSKSRRLLNFVAAAAAIVLIAGFFAYQDLPNIDLRLASASAGFHANLPSWRPSGFSFHGPVTYSPGNVTVSFNSTSDGRSYKIIEQQSNWDSQTLVDNFVTTADQHFQTIDNGGNSLYLYSGNLTWVNSNIWYRITNGANLSPTQLTHIATSM